MADSSLSKTYEGGILSGLTPQAWAPESSGVSFVTGPEYFSGLTPYQSHQDVVAGVAVPPVLPAGIIPLTVDQLRAIMPNAKSSDIEAAQMPLAIAMADHGISLPAQQAAFLGQIAAEGGMRGKTENLRDYNAARLMQVFNRPVTLFPSAEDARQYAGDEQKTANYVYNGKNGNVPGTDDGWRYRGRGPMQVTGRGNYRAVGFEDNPEALETPYGGAQASAAWWINNRLPERTASELNRRQFDGITNIVNRGVDLPSRDLRWQTYRHALDILGR